MNCGSSFGSLHSCCSLSMVSEKIMIFLIFFAGDFLLRMLDDAVSLVLDEPVRELLMDESVVPVMELSSSLLSGLYQFLCFLFLLLSQVCLLPHLPCRS
jgi:hypothetical protein